VGLFGCEGNLLAALYGRFAFLPEIFSVRARREGFFVDIAGAACIINL
jgi:hypothetical protein